MATADNILQQVITYQKSGLALLTNLNCFISSANKKFKDFQNLTANLGSTVSFDLTPRFNTTNGLIANFEAVEQRFQNLTVDQSANISYAFSAEQFLFNVHDYMEKFGRGAVAELGAKIEANVALNCETQPYRFFGDGVTDITTFLQLATALARFRNYGAPKVNTRGYLSDIAVPNIANSGLSQFTTKRNDEMANSWEIGSFSKCEWMQSNLLPVHTSGTEGTQATSLTVVSVTKDANNAITNILFSGTNAASDASSVLKYDRFQFTDAVAGRTNVRFLTFTGHQVSAQPCQFRATANATSTGGSQVNVAIYPPLIAAAGKNQNINTEIVAGMKCTVLPSHRVGLITSGDPLFLAMPKLPPVTPFPSSSEMDPETGVSMRQYYGSLFGQNQQGMVHDNIWGSTLVPEYSMALIFKL